MTFAHLTDEQLTEHLSGVSLPAIDDHLAGCEVCRQEVATMRASLQLFDHASLEWSGRIQNDAGPGRTAPSWRPAAAWAVVCAAVIAAVLLFGVLRRPVQVSPSGNAAATATRESNTAELSEDNQFLSAIDKELDSADLSPQKMYGISESAKAR
jgi:hypothetical protein